MKADGAEVVDAAGSQGSAQRDRDTCPVVDNSWLRNEGFLSPEECGNTHTQRTNPPNNTHSHRTKAL